ncbi:hypothetical protein TNIN_22901 [Trichonephila inaurata madagascariensis]|uniref:Uncharacterized protein n=1 Tax=Trichonephila inaurata madagascariensis TaxID=2747483 RepID=A0A8X7BZX8_9ARAC|nr:hypothetical protein TNIN_22901 [Trichonephila inaurata madagascariensis]
MALWSFSNAPVTKGPSEHLVSSHHVAIFLEEIFRRPSGRQSPQADKPPPHQSSHSVTVLSIMTTYTVASQTRDQTMVRLQPTSEPPAVINMYRGVWAASLLSRYSILQR